MSSSINIPNHDDNDNYDYDELMSRFYQRYVHYPEYCSTPTQMKQRHIPIPPPSSTTSTLSFQLVHATVVIRHGSRTTWSGPTNLKCWNGFWNSHDTGVWDCADDLTTIMTTPFSASASNSSTSSSSFMYKKLYDSLIFPQDQLQNELNGTCQLGQLLIQGYYQELYNGQILRQAYTYNNSQENNEDSNNNSQQINMNLIDLNIQLGNDNDDSLPWSSKQLHFRSDDDQRTVMSGQIVVRSLFGREMKKLVQQNHMPFPTIQLHIADRDKDIMDANENDCPRLTELHQQAVLSTKYQQFNTSKESQQIRQFIQQQLWDDDDNNVALPVDKDDLLDCLMCTICTDRPLHPSVDDYNDGSLFDHGDNNANDTSTSTSSSRSKSWFTRLAQHTIQQYTIPMKYNDSQYAKLSMGPLWYEIMKNMNPYTTTSSTTSVDAPKLALFSGHDTTIMPLLASISPNLWNDTDWATYASMLVIEIYHVSKNIANDANGDDTTTITSNDYPSGVAWRLLYNGKVLTQFVDGCNNDNDLCDIQYLKSKIDPIATRDPRLCTLLHPLSSTSFAVVDLSTPTGVTIYIGSVIFGFVVGVFLAWICCVRRCRRRQIILRDGYEIQDGIMNGGSSSLSSKRGGVGRFRRRQNGNKNMVVQSAADYIDDDDGIELREQGFSDE